MTALDQQEINEPSSTVEGHSGRPGLSPTKARALAAPLLAGCVGVLALSVWLTPDQRGYGTAEQFGGPCGVLITTGLPCPTCGMTTAFAHTVRGQWLQALWVQPTGFVLCLATTGGAVLGGWVLLRGRWPAWPFHRLAPHHIFLTLLVLLLAGWGFKILAGLADGTLPYR